MIYNIRRYLFYLLTPFLYLYCFWYNLFIGCSLSVTYKSKVKLHYHSSEWFFIYIFNVILYYTNNYFSSGQALMCLPFYLYDIIVLFLENIETSFKKAVVNSAVFFMFNYNKKLVCYSYIPLVGYLIVY